ncbi:MAG TPA: helix-turn-helix transcriptional regulator [Desulfobacterales bacterium]|nr:helix-turn-helix transcriptional regulator [Desulfobacterales bacterium]
MADRYEFGRWLQQKRNDVGITQIEASRQFGFISKASVVGYENGLSPIPIKRLLDLSRIYQIPMAELLEKLRECDPKLAKEFDQLAIMFSEYQISLIEQACFLRDTTQDLTHSGGKMTGLHKQNYQDTGYRHHKPFLNEDGYLEVDRSIYYQTLISLIKEVSRKNQPEIIFPGLTNFDRNIPKIVTDMGSCAHLRDCYVNFDQREPSMQYIRPVKTVQIH